MVDIKVQEQKLGKLWQRFIFHQAWLRGESLFPYLMPLPKVTDKKLLHDFATVHKQLMDLRGALAESNGITLVEQEFQFATMGRQRIPVAIEFADIEALARFLGEWLSWQKFTVDAQLLSCAFPELRLWLADLAWLIDKHQGRWPELIAVCRYFLVHPQPDLYLRQLDIPGVDSKFIESHKSVLKKLLDQLLPEQAINREVDTLSGHGFEQRFGLRYEQPLVRFRLLDAQLAAEFGGVTDLTLPLAEFARLTLLLDRVFITENKINGLAFPAVNNALVIFGLGYGIQMLKQVPWLCDCRIHYWGDIDSNGFAILSQLRGYFPNVQSFLMDETTILQCRKLWGKEPVANVHTATMLSHLLPEEQQVYQRIKSHYWHERLRLEQERIPFNLLQQALQTQLK